MVGVSNQQSSIQQSAFGIQHSAFSLQHSARKLLGLKGDGFVGMVSAKKNLLAANTHDKLGSYTDHARYAASLQPKMPSGLSAKC